MRSSTAMMSIRYDCELVYRARVWAIVGSFSGSSRFSIVKFLRSGRSGGPPLHHTLPEPDVTVEEDDGESTNNSSGSPTDSGNSTNWTFERGPSPLDPSGLYLRREDARA
ncbi:hypothetical protein EVAR_103427_1 [Eumeta japonica]|uniref:Uncharacterized protein n=1 Tax=Eumeta variegata TaxID=151549 RepID=A0A4C1ZBC5_EUMVA|nr:hypothetical protein EVAR_103427_1 [Eumeta japonica]